MPCVARQISCKRAANALLASGLSGTLGLKFSSRHLTTTAVTPLTLLHKTTSILPRILFDNDTADFQKSREFWRERLAKTFEDIKEDWAARIVVYGIDQFSAARDLVSAILEEPFASEATTVRMRWKDRDPHSPLTIQGGSTAGPSTLVSSSTFLRQFSVPLQITELPHTSQGVSSLLDADIPVVIFNPLSTPLSDLATLLPLLATNPNSILIITCASPSPLLQTHVRNHFAKAIRSVTHLPLTTLFVNPSLTLRGLDTLRNNPNSPLNIQQYQDDVSQSNISSVHEALRAIFVRNTSSTTLRAHTALSKIRLALYVYREALLTARRDVEGVSGFVSTLRGQMEETRAKVHGEVFGVKHDMVEAALNSSEVDVRNTMDSLTWWRMILKVDDIGVTVSNAANLAWCRELEQDLILQTGRLSNAQQTLTRHTMSEVAKLPLTSPILLNTLNQTQISPSYSLTPRSLTHPLYTRINQLQHPTNQLHLAAQKTVFGLGTAVATSVGLGVGSWATHVGGLSMWGFGGMEAGSALGVGLLGTVLGIRWAVASWEKAKRKWWDDWKRVGEGLKRDLSKTLDQTIENQVFVIARGASDGLENLAKGRQNAIEELSLELDSLEDDLEKVNVVDPQKGSK